MPLKYLPKMGTIVVCDFSGFTAPEINKVRPVVVVAPQLPYREKLAMVVPLSTTAPMHRHPFCIKLERNYTPWGEPNDDSWAKADMVLSVSLERLNAFKVSKRKWEFREVSAADLIRIREGIVHSIGMSHLLIRQGDAI